ncbi:hypothetical protein QTP70_018736 [Hemibagrus guttatus]|uniref:Rab effector MyRIP/Melanophilin domain-containing protein n=1 Tax=Hemibagrus guttatus TaxID=175788 RepID=A0AAE0Q8B3_9TELE|nr:hypothetical protein QTP70_018736 [Hemibagrus guttatus]
MQAEYDFVWSQTHSSDLPSTTSTSSTRTTSQPSTITKACCKASWVRYITNTALYSKISGVACVYINAEWCKNSVQGGCNMDMDMFREAATNGKTTDLEEYVSSVTRAGDKDALRTALAKLSRAISESKHAHSQRIHGHFQSSGDTRRMWQGVQSIRPASPACDSDASLPDALNSFCAWFEARNDVTTRKTIPPPEDQVLCLTTADTRKTLCRVNPWKAAGPDNIPDSVLRECAEQLVDVFTNIFNISVSSAIVPTCVKTNTIIPVPKKSPVSCLNDYRPIALTNHHERSLSALSLTSDESPDKSPEADKVSEAAEPEPNLEIYSSLRRESRASILGWKNVDRLDNSTFKYFSASSVLQSPDGNWIALQTSQHSRPSLLTKRKSLVFSVLEKESGVVSAYDEMGSDSEDGEECDSWGLALLQFRQRLTEETHSSNSQRDTENYPPITSPSSGHFTNTETINSDSENSLVNPRQTQIPVYNVTQKNKASPELLHGLPYMPFEQYRPAIRLSHSPRLGALDVNFNPQVIGDSSEGEEQAEQIQRLRRRKRNKRESAEQSRVHNVLYTGENSTLFLNTMMMKGQDNQETPSSLSPPTNQLPDTVTPLNHVTSPALTPEFVYKNTVASNPVLPSSLMYTQSENDTLDHELRSKLSELVYQFSKEELTSSDDEPIRKVIDRQHGGEREKESDRKYSAASLCSITTEVLKVLNATEELIGEAEGKGHEPHDSPAGTPLSSGPNSRKLDQHLTKMEENVYLAAGTVYGLEGALSDLEDCARSISSSTTETELAFLEDQVATAAVQVQQSELQISDIEARISALKNAGLNVSVCSRFPKLKPQTLDSSRQQRRKLPAPPTIENSETESRSLQP